jgi:protoporphyrinogen IX oxidase
MIGWLGEAYLWVKSLHVIFVIFWMAGLFMLPRFLVYWMAASSPGEEKLWAERCVRLRRIILTPGLVITWAAGLMLAFHLGFTGNGWLHAKLAIVIALTGYHGWCVGASKRFTAGLRPYSEKALRLLNEVPSLVTIAVVILVIVKPF